MMTPLVNFARLFTAYLLVLSVTALPRPAAKSNGPLVFLNRLLIFAILIISTLPLCAQCRAPNAAELAQKVVSIISGDKAKTQTYCQVLDLSDELDQVDQQKDREKAQELSRKISELQKKLG